jgi:hypothetical protein
MFKLLEKKHFLQFSSFNLMFYYAKKSEFINFRNPAGYPISSFQISGISGQISTQCIP